MQATKAGGIWAFIDKLTGGTMIDQDDKERREVERDIARFQQGGTLPRDNDVTEGGPSYWEWVDGRNGGKEPLFNSWAGEGLLDPTAGTNNGAVFAAWRATGFYDLSYQDQELFVQVWENGLDPIEAGRLVGLGKSAAYRRLQEIRDHLAKVSGVRVAPRTDYYRRANRAEGTIGAKPKGWGKKQTGAE